MDSELPILRPCLGSSSYPGTMSLRPPSLLCVPAVLPALHSADHPLPPGTRTTARVLPSSNSPCSPHPTTYVLGPRKPFLTPDQGTRA